MSPKESTLVCQTSKVLTYTIQHALGHLGDPKDKKFCLGDPNKILFSNHFERCTEEILKLDGKVSISQALTAFLSASYISQFKEKSIFQ